MADLLKSNYQIELGSLKEVEQANYGKIDYLRIALKVGYCEQGYPASKTPNGASEQIEYFKEIFEVNDIKDAINKEVLVVCNFCDIFALVNLENNKIFSIQAKFFPENYSETLQQIKVQEGNDFLKKLSDTEALLTGVVKNLKNTANPKLQEIVEKIIDTNNLYKILNQEISTKESTNSKKKNKI